MSPNKSPNKQKLIKIFIELARAYPRDPPPFLRNQPPGYSLVNS